MNLKKKRPVLVVQDMSQLVYRTVFTANKIDPLDTKYVLWKNMIVERLLNDLLYFKADRYVIAMDDTNYWRKDIYADYKNKRKSKRKKSVVDFDEFFKVANPFIEELEQVFPNVQFLRTNRCEADDIVAVLTKDRWSEYDIVCISTDSDLKQLYKYNYYKQYDPIRMKIFTPINSKKDLMVKLLTGDTADDIPNVKVRCGKVTAKKMIDEGLDKIFKDDPEIEKNFKRNKQLIDLDMIPEKYKKQIKDTYDACIINKYNGRKLFNFLMKHRMRGMIENLEVYSKTLMNLG